MENPIKIDDLGGFPPIFGNTQMDFFVRKYPSGTLAMPPSKQRKMNLKSQIKNLKQQLHSRKLMAGGPQNDGLEKVTPFKHGNFWYLC